MMDHDKWILDGKTPVSVDLMTWAKWFEAADRKVAREDVGHYWVSTTFLGLDHNFDDHGPPLLFETMVFKQNSFEEVWCERTATWDEAEAAHRRGVEFAVSLSLKPESTP